MMNRLQDALFYVALLASTLVGASDGVPLMVLGCAGVMVVGELWSRSL